MTHEENAHTRNLKVANTGTDGILGSRVVLADDGVGTPKMQAFSRRSRPDAWHLQRPSGGQVQRADVAD